MRTAQPSISGPLVAILLSEAHPPGDKKWIRAVAVAVTPGRQRVVLARSEDLGTGEAVYIFSLRYRGVLLCVFRLSN